MSRLGYGLSIPLIFICLCISLCGGCAKHDPQPTAVIGERLTQPQRLQLQIARMHFDNGDYELARKEYTRMILNQPTAYMQEIAEYMLAESYFAAGDFPMAQRYYRQYLLNFPGGFKRAESDVRISECDNGLREAQQRWSTAKLRELAQTPAEPVVAPATPAASIQKPRVRTTFYWIENEKNYPASSRRVPLLDVQGGVLARVAEGFLKRVKIEGTGRLRDGTVVNWAAPERFVAIVGDALKAAPFGYGVGRRPLIPFRSIAVDRQVVALDSVVYIAQYAGVTLPNGETHDGCFVAADVGSAIKGDHIDLFAPSYEDAVFVMQRAGERVDLQVAAAPGVPVGPCRAKYEVAHGFY